MILFPMDVEIPKSERVVGMDTTEWWQANGEFPGILNWALMGLTQLLAHD
jgi:hypothetical protein